MRTVGTAAPALYHTDPLTAAPLPRSPRSPVARAAAARSTGKMRFFYFLRSNMLPSISGQQKIIGHFGFWGAFPVYDMVAIGGNIPCTRRPQACHLWKHAYALHSYYSGTKPDYVVIVKKLPGLSHIFYFPYHHILVSRSVTCSSSSSMISVKSSF